MHPRLLIIGINFAPESSGIAPYTASLARGMADLGWQVKVITGFPHYPQWVVYDGYEGRSRTELDGKIEILRLRHYVPGRPKLLNRLFMELDFGLRSVLANWGKPDVILFVSPGLFSSALAVVRAKLSRRRPGTAVWVQDLYSRGLEELHSSAASFAPVMRVAESATFRAVDRTIVIHDRFYRHAVDTLGVDAKRVVIQRNWAHIPVRQHVDVAAVRDRRGWGKEEIVVLHAGNMGLKQYLENVVEAARLAANTGSRVRFVLLGGGSQRQKLQSLASGISQLEFIDPLPDAEYTNVLAAADILLVNESPQLREMCVPSKLTSYFSTGRPVLAAVNSGSATAGEVEASQAGWIIAPGEPERLVRAAEKMAADRALASALGDHGPSYAAEHLSTDTAMCRWNGVLRSLSKRTLEPEKPFRLNSPT